MSYLCDTFGTMTRRPPEAPAGLRARITAWPDLNRRERAEVGRALRRLGWSYGEICGLLPVPKGTLAGWCRDIRLTDDQVRAITARRGTEAGVRRDTQRKRQNEIASLRADAAAEVPTLVHEPLWVAGTVLYWGEGSKKARRLELTNADADALRLFIAWTRRFHDNDAEFVLALHLHEGNDETAARLTWREALSLPAATFNKTFVKPRGSGHRKNHLPEGVCRVRMRRSTDAWLRTLSWIDVLPMYLGLGESNRC